MTSAELERPESSYVIFPQYPNVLCSNIRMQGVLRKLNPASHGRTQYCVWCSFTPPFLEVDHMQKKQ